MPGSPGGLGNPKAPVPRTWGKESVLCPRSFTTVSEELEVEELISFTMSPARRREEEEGAKVILGWLSSAGIHSGCPWGQRLPQRNAVPSAQQLHLQPALPTKPPKFAPKWHSKLSPGSLASQKPPSMELEMQVTFWVQLQSRSSSPTIP